MDRLSLSIVIPAFNEERRLGETLVAVTEFLGQQPWDWEVRVVDDGSSDRTAAIAEAFAVRQPSSGSCSASRTAARAVRSRPGLLAATGEFRFICDADLSMPIGEVARFLPPAAHGFDVAIGSREGLRAHRIGEPVVPSPDGPAVQSRVSSGSCCPASRTRSAASRCSPPRLSRSIFPRVDGGRVGVRRRGAGGGSCAAACASSKCRSSGTIAPSRVSAWCATDGRC